MLQQRCASGGLVAPLTLCSALCQGWYSPGSLYGLLTAAGYSLTAAGDHCTVHWDGRGRGTYPASDLQLETLPEFVPLPLP